MYRKRLVVAAVIMLMILTVVSCGAKDPAASPSDTTTPATASTDTPQPSAAPSASPSLSPSIAPTASMEEQEMILSLFDGLLNTPGKEKAALNAMGNDIKILSPEKANEMLLAFEAYQRKAISDRAVLSDNLIQLIEKSPEPYNEKTLNDLSKITDNDLKTALQALFERGYKIIVPEGMYEAVIDYSAYTFAKEDVTQDIAAYIDIMAAESANRMAADAAILVPIDEVFDRAQAVQHFLTTYPSSAKYDEMHKRFGIYVDAWFFGLDNTPAFDTFSKKLKQTFLDSYQKVSGSGETDVLTRATVDYLEFLKENDYTLTATVRDYRKNMTNGLKNSAS